MKKKLHFAFRRLFMLTLFISFFAIVRAQNAAGDTILNVTYETGTLSSGINGVTGTYAPAADAAYMVIPGATGNYAIAHKIVHGDSNYVSAGAYRSESDADYANMCRFLPGDKRRYEFSVLLKDWTPWNNGDPADETNIFQLKITGPNVVPLQVRAQRNTIRLRMPDYPSGILTADILPDFRPYVNQWMHFRVDVSWDSTAAGYMKVYMKLPGQSDYVLKYERLNYINYPAPPDAHGYIKWGLYITPPNITRIAYHDDIRIINLNEASDAPGLIWGDGISDANPAYLDGPYTKAPNTTNPATFNTAGSMYIHPYMQYSDSRNIVYFNSTNPTPDSTDNIAGTPRSDYSRNTLIPGGSTGGTPGPGGRYYVTGWANAASASSPSALDTTQYYSFHLEPKNGYYFNFDSVLFTVYRGSSSATTFALRSSQDQFTTDIAPPVQISGTASTPISFDASALSFIDTAITFRLYPYGATSISGTKLVGINDFRFYGQVLPPSDFGDAPESYGTSSTGHRIGGSVYLGILPPDMDTTALPGALALKDNNVGIDDEDGISNFPAIAGGNNTNINNYTLSLSLNNSSGALARLNGWIDWNGNGRFDTGESASANVPDGADSTTLSWNNVVLGGANGSLGTYARFRISTDTIKNSMPAGSVVDGEVEDYYIPFAAPLNITPLSVLLTRFNASKEGKSAVLDWEISAEPNAGHYHFGIERSGPAGEWQEIGKVNSIKQPSEPRYRFRDVQPLSGVNHYRLRKTDIDGQVTLSEVRTLTFKNAGGIQTLPNPAKDEALLIFDSSLNGPVQIIMYNSLGQSLMSRSVYDTSKTYKLDLSGLPQGIYTVSIQGAGYSAQIKLVKQ